MIFLTLFPHYHLFCCVIGSAGHSVFQERLCGNVTDGAAKPTNQEPLWRLALPSPISTVNNMVMSTILEWAIIDFALFLLVVTMGTRSTPLQKHQTLNCKEFSPGTTLQNFKSRAHSICLFFFPFLCFSWVGGVWFRPSLSPSKLKVKEDQMRASLFSIQHPFLDHRELVFFNLLLERRRLV